LPVFFAYSGLRTQIGLLNKPELWVICFAILAVAIIGKYLGTYVAARASGIAKREASALGWLMNTRGLTELIVLNIGLSLGVISPLLFTMLVIMALVTTFMTSPLLEWTFPKHLIQLDVSDEGEFSEENEEMHSPISQPLPEKSYRILVPVANSSTQKRLTELAIAIAGTNKKSEIHLLSLIQLEEDYVFQSTPAEANRLMAERRSELEALIETLEPETARSLISPIIRATNDVARETSQIAEIDHADLILLGWHRSTFSNNRLGGRVGQILTQARVDVAVFVERSLHKLDNLLVPYSANFHDDLGLEIALRLLLNDERRHLTVLRVVNGENPEREISYEFEQVMEQLPKNVRSRIDIPIIESMEPLHAVVEASKEADLTIAGTSREWGIERQTLGRYTDELASQCHSSVLITRRYRQVTSHLSSLLSKNG